MKKLHLLLFTVFAALLLAGCGRYVAQVNLTPEERAEHEQIIAVYTEKLRNWDPSDPEQQREAILLANPGTAASLQTPEGETVGNVDVEFSETIEKRPPFQYFMKISYAQEQLGYLSDALNTYKKAMSIYENSQVAWNNMGRLEEQMGRYKKAIAYYQKILDVFAFTQYYLDISRAYVRLGDADAAMKAYNAFRMETNQADLGLEDEIQALREKK